MIFPSRPAASRTRSSAGDRPSRLRVRRLLCWLAFPPFHAQGPPPSTGSAAGRPALFVGFSGTMEESDFSRPCIIGCGLFGLPDADHPIPPVSGAIGMARREISRFPCKEFPCVHEVYDHARPVQALARARPSVLPSPLSHRVGALDAYPFAAQYPARMYPCQRFADTLAEARRMTRGRCGWLTLHRTALSSATPRRPPGARDALLNSPRDPN